MEDKNEEADNGVDRSTEAQKNHTIYKHFLSLNATKLLYPCEQLHAVLNCLQNNQVCNLKSRKSHLVEGIDFRVIFSRLIVAITIHYLSSLLERLLCFRHS